MQQNSLSNAENRVKSIKWVELVLYLSDIQYLDHDKIHRWHQQFGKITVAGVGTRPAGLASHIVWHPYTLGEDRSTIWNQLLEKAQKDWVLFIEDDEQLQLNDFPEKGTVTPQQWVPSLIQQGNSGNSRKYYQMRLVHIQGKKLFKGKNLPDCTHYIRENNVGLSEKPFIIERKTDPVAHVDPDEELSIKDPSPQLYLVLGERYFNERKYVRAAAQYRQLLKTEKLLPFDRLGAVNGLTSCLTEQHKWTKALTLTHESVQAEPQQYLPYLIQFKIYELNKQWKKSYEVLLRYSEIYSHPSKANFDKAIDEEETILTLANLSLKAGNREQASRHFEKLFNLKKGAVDRAFLHRMLILSIDLKDYEKAVYFFKEMFEGKLLDHSLNDEEQDELNDFMSLFMKCGWYEYVSTVYKKLYALDPSNREYKRRLIVTLTKTNRIEKARELLSNVG